MLAPRRVPPCFTTSVEASYSDMKRHRARSPRPWCDFTMSPDGRRRLKPKPVPPPDWCTSAIDRSVS